MSVKALLAFAAVALTAFSALAPAARAQDPAASTAACAGQPGPARLNVVVDGLRDARGQVVITLYPDDAKRFLVHKGKLNLVRVDAVMPATSACLWLPAPGWYAVAVYHDANGSHKFNRNALGLPTEGFGLSNNPALALAWPTLGSARFQTHAGENTIHIRLRYL